MLKYIFTALMTAAALRGAHAETLSAPLWFAAPSAEKAPGLEAGLDDPAWKNALEIPLSKLFSGAGETQKYKAESYWLYSGGSLFVAFKCFHLSSPHLWAKPGQSRDCAAYENESVELFLGNFKGDLYYQFVVDAAGNIYDGKGFNSKWDGDWKCAAKCFDGYWTAVLEIRGAVLKDIWEKGSFITISAGRHAFNSDGSGGELTVVSPPGFHAPRDRMFIDTPNPAALGDALEAAVKNFRDCFRQTALPGNVEGKLAVMGAFSLDCRKAGDMPLESCKEFFSRYESFMKELGLTEKKMLLSAMFNK